MSNEVLGILIGLYIAGAVIALIVALEIEISVSGKSVLAFSVFWPIFLLKALVSGFMEAWKG